ncbi:unnamed protein product [Caenorhabditis angaria]|uniref:Uncharacterized protein n=1 Tax=Caenorhabditis angaria TaxID=860376 RepID=A0A9P1IXH5_9PELO|nr:unnamed protein product [Caenorhabditis angaria]
MPMSIFPDINIRIKQLVLQPDEIVIRELTAFLQINAFAESENDSKLDQQEQIELMHKKRKLVAQFSKLIIHGCFPVSCLLPLVRNYVSHFTDFGDIFNNLLYKCRDVDFVETAETLVTALQEMFEELLETKKQLDPLSDSFNALRDLAKRFASAFGSDYSKNRYAVATIHKSAIDFAFRDFDTTPKGNDKPPKNLFFLEIAIEFSSKLLAQDKAAVMRYLNKTYPEAAPGKGQWEPYKLYIASLTEKRNDFNDDASSVRSFSTVRSDSSHRSTPRGRGRGRGGIRRNVDF